LILRGHDRRVHAFLAFRIGPDVIDFTDWNDSCTLDREIARMIDRLEFNRFGGDRQSGLQTARPRRVRISTITTHRVFTRAWLDAVLNQETFENNRE
jgi:hypothetical protein